MEHKHIYDKDGKQLCCTQEEKNSNFTKTSFLKRIISIFLLIYHSFGTLLLPMGDFTVLKDLHDMYEHCRVNEDKDMTPFDFVTDHLLNIDGFFDSHGDGDNQKPHSPTHIHYQVHLVTFQSFVSFDFRDKTIPYFEPKLRSNYVDNFIKSDYISLLFRPPIVA
jgi:hypothetical protein